jgi:hypothetical protein
MMKDEKSISSEEEIVIESKDSNVPKKVFNCVFLGTDTEYEPTYKNPEYPKREGFSDIASQIESKEKPTIDSSDTSLKPPAGYAQYKTENTTVYKGAKTSGGNTHKIMAEALCDLMNKIAEGYVDINIMGHSRGACQSIITPWYLDVMKDFIAENENSSLEGLLSHLATCEKNIVFNIEKNTYDVVPILIENLKNTKFSFETFKKNILETSVTIPAAVDPVPGNPDMFYLTWYDKRLFTLPKIVKEAYLYFNENERSSCFSTIAVKATNTGQLIHNFKYKGHHGTVTSGLNTNQLGEEIKVPKSDGKSFYKVTQSTKVFRFSLWDNLRKTGVVFKKHLDLFKDDRKLGSQWIVDSSGNPTKKIENIDVRKTKINFYKNIMDNDPAFRNLENYSYRFISRHDKRRVIVGLDKNGYNIYKSFEEVYPSKAGYVNDEHAQLMFEYCLEILQINDLEKKSLTEIIKLSHKKLAEEIKLLEKEEGLFKIEDTRKDLIIAFVDLVNRIGSEYLTTDWSSEQGKEDKVALFRSVKEMIKFFATTAKSKNKDIKEFAEQLNNTCRTALQKTITQQYLALSESFVQLTQPQEDELISVFQELATQLLAPKHLNGLYTDILSIQGAEDSDLTLKLNDQIEHIKKSTKLSEASRQKDNLDDEIREILKAQSHMRVFQQKIKDLHDSEVYKNKKFETINDRFNYLYGELDIAHLAGNPLDGTFHISTLLQQIDGRFGKQLKDFEKLYNELVLFTEDIDGLRGLESDIANSYTNDSNALGNAAYQITKWKGFLIVAAAKSFFTGKDITLSENDESFLYLAEKYAIHKGWAYDLIHKESLQRQENLENDKKKLEGDKSILVQDKEKLNKDILALESKNKKLLEEINKTKNQLYKGVYDNLVELTTEYKNHLKDTSRAGTDKSEAVDKLLKCLNDENKPLLSDKITAFYEELELQAGTIQPNSKNGYYRFIKAAVIIGLSVITFIVPGLLVFLLYAEFIDNGAYDFLTSTGDSFYKEAYMLKESQEEHKQKNSSFFKEKPDSKSEPKDGNENKDEDEDEDGNQYNNNN